MTPQEQITALMSALPIEYRLDIVRKEAYDVQLDGKQEIIVFFRRDDLSNYHYYTRKHVIDVLSTINNWGKLKQAILAITGFKGMSFAQREYQIEQRGFVADVCLAPYFKYEPTHIEGFIDGTMMRYTEVYPYDD